VTTSRSTGFPRSRCRPVRRCPWHSHSQHCRLPSTQYPGFWRPLLGSSGSSIHRLPIALAGAAAYERR
jgi:hypothetical protein